MAVDGGDWFEVRFERSMWLSGVSIVCFAASYAVALVLEVTRLFFRSGIRGAIMLGFAGAGLFAHTVYLFYRAVNATGSPLSSRQDWCLVAAWVLVAVYLYLTYYHPQDGLRAVHPAPGAGVDRSGHVPGRRRALRPGAGLEGLGGDPRRVDPAGHGGRAGGVCRRADVSRAGLSAQAQAAARCAACALPSLEWLRRANSRAVGIALLTLAAGILSGMVLNLINYGPESERLPWNDPVVLSTLVMFAWLVLCAGVGRFYRPAREGRKVAFLTDPELRLPDDRAGGGARWRDPARGPGAGGQGPGARGQGSGARVQGSGARVQGSGAGFRVTGSRVQDLWSCPLCPGDFCPRAWAPSVSYLRLSTLDSPLPSSRHCYGGSVT